MRLWNRNSFEHMLLHGVPMNYSKPCSNLKSRPSILYYGSNNKALQNEDQRQALRNQDSKTMPLRSDASVRTHPRFMDFCRDSVDVWRRLAEIDWEKSLRKHKCLGLGRSALRKGLCWLCNHKGQ